MMAKALIIYAHPAHQRSQANQTLLDTIAGIADVTVHDLYEEYPNFHIDVEREQALLLEHDIIVFQHPVYWYSAPALLREWQDLVLVYGFAYGRSSQKLVGKVFWPVLTAGAAQSSYSEEGINRHTLADFFIAYAQIAHLCGMRYEKPYEIFSSRQQTQAAIQDVANGYRDKLIELLAGMTHG